eukprot:CAMPEP_0116894710 /NCGR_PEP_ID=MMETSP0467-20121206/4416_1 /TAXON_ID=283647 /ORGANISM="Mesodinium pulex, Strain SPMC105" /LENGTH=123 /DNA_ID=CAMNT_0004565077 /DNA_START=789 /DNA_END=1160 /DNA_ORIENTATION=-
MIDVMHESLKIPVMGLSEEIRFDEFKKQFNSVREKGFKLDGHKLTLTPVFLKVLSVCLTQFPLLNSSYESRDQWVQWEEHNVSVAFDTPNGLMVPNVKRVNHKTILEISKDLEVYKNKVRDQV